MKFKCGNCKSEFEAKEKMNYCPTCKSWDIVEVKNTKIIAFIIGAIVGIIITIIILVSNTTDVVTEEPITTQTEEPITTQIEDTTKNNTPQLSFNYDLIENKDDYTITINVKNINQFNNIEYFVNNKKQADKSFNLKHGQYTIKVTSDNDECIQDIQLPKIIKRLAEPNKDNLQNEISKLKDSAKKISEIETLFTINPKVIIEGTNPNLYPTLNDILLDIEGGKDWTIIDITWDKTSNKIDCIKIKKN